jgi:hypothetical protein
MPAGTADHVLVPFSRPRFDMKMIVVVVAAVTMAACDRTTNNTSGMFVTYAPTLAIAAQISPQTLPLVIATTPCTSGTAFTTGFDLVIVTGPVDLFIDQVMWRLIDGTGLGGPSITIPQPELNSMFGSTRVVGTRAFSFRPQFACGPGRPGSIAGSVVLKDAEGMFRTVNVDAVFR